MQKMISFVVALLFITTFTVGCAKSDEEQATRDITITPKEIGERSAVVTWTTTRSVPITIEIRPVHGKNKESRYIDGGHGTRGIVTLPNLEAGKYYEVRAISLEQMGGEGKLQPTSKFWSFFTSEVGKANGWSGMASSTVKAFAGAGY